MTFLAGLAGISRRALALALIVATLALACGAPPKVVRTYAGSPRPASELAVVRSARHRALFPGGALNVATLAVDGTPVPTGSWIWQAPPDLELEPGTHTLTIAIDEGGNVRTLHYPQVTFRAEAGHLYELRAERVPGSFEPGLFSSRFAWRWWLVDTTTGATAAASAPDAPPAE
jgi:hypothetical protein